MSSSTRPITAPSCTGEGENELFEEFIDSDSFNSSDNGIADRANADDWSILFDFAPPYNQNSYPDLLKCSLRNECFPIAETTKNQTGLNDADYSASLVDLDSIKYPTPPLSIASLSSRKSGRVNERISLSNSKSRSSAVSKPAKKISAPPQMSHPGGSRRQSSEKRASISGSSTTSGRGQSRPSYPQAPTPITPSQWPSSRTYPVYDEPSTSGPQVTGAYAFRDQYTSQSPLQLSRSTSAQLSPLTSPGYEEFSTEESSSYFQSPSTPYATEAEASLAHDFPDFSQYPSETSFQFDPTHESSMTMPYARDSEYADSQVQPWWNPASVTQPYNTTYPTATYDHDPHVSPSSPSQSDLTTDIGGLMTQRHANVRESNYSNIGYGQHPQNQAYPQAHESAGVNVTTTNKGRGRSQATVRSSHQFTEPILRSSSPSAATQGIRKPAALASSQQMIGSAAAGSSKQTKKKSAVQSGSRRDQPQGIDFVNYTAEDKKKILTGVAPSGSSKTKIRREKEAADRRRRISRATAKAVQEAGGDLEALKREGFILEEEDEDEDEEASHSGS